MSGTAFPEKRDAEPLNSRVFAALENLGTVFEKGLSDPLRPQRFDLGDLSPEERAQIVTLLGEGEISGRVLPVPGEGGEILHIRESVYPGLWLLGSRSEESGGVALARIEAGASPGILVQPPSPSPLLAAGGLGSEDPESSRLRPLLMNALPLLEEASFHLAHYDPGKTMHRIFLNKLPLSEGDAEWIDRVLAGGRISLGSKGYGDCQVLSTPFSGLWRVLYKNPEGIPLLDALCVAGLPDEIAATPEDMARGISDFRDFLDWASRDLS
ncbi:MAG: hydrogenase expression/formation protein [Nitrospirae bacterium]|nr:hydrogenase expression/formation protein [Nitrospirota bacterium]